MQTDDQRTYENELAARAGQGSKEAFEALYRAFYDSIYRYCAWQTAQSHDAEDLTQNVFIEAAKSIRRYKQQGDFRSWLYTIAKRQVTKWVREKYKLPQAPLYDIAQEDPAWISPENESKKKSLVRRLLQKLSSQERDVVRWRYMRELTVQEVAAKLDLSASNVKVIAHRALKKLRL